VNSNNKRGERVKGSYLIALLFLHLAEYKDNGLPSITENKINYRN
jgi:hypothetical protein